MMKKIIICGGGIAGLTAALCLTQEGFSCEVYEAKDNRPTSTAAIILAPSGVRVLAALGLCDAATEKACPVSAIKMRDIQGRVLADLPTHNKEYFGHDCLAMTRRALHTLLTGRCTELHIPIHYNAKLLQAEQSADSVVAEFEHYGKVIGDVLIGADGIHSIARNAVVDKSDVIRKDRQYYGIGMIAPVRYLSDEERGFLRLTETAMNLLRGPVGFVGFIGVGRPDQSGEAKFMMWSHIAASEVGDSFNCRDSQQIKHAMQRLRSDWCQPVSKMLELIDQSRPDIEIGCLPITSLYPIPRWSNRRVVLIGDAAHGYGPGAQGAALAMEDAMLLSQMLKRLDDFSAPALSRCFSDFEQKRRPRVERIGNASEARNDSRLESTGFARAMIEKYALMLLGWWYKNGYRNAEYGYRVEDDLSPFVSKKNIGFPVWIRVLIVAIIIWILVKYLLID